jgi:hypothetical protein
MDKFYRLSSLIKQADSYINESKTFMDQAVKLIDPIKEMLLAKQITSTDDNLLTSTKDIYNKMDAKNRESLEKAEIERFNEKVFNTGNINTMSGEAIHKIYDELITEKAQVAFVLRLGNEFPLKYSEWDAYSANLSNRTGGRQKKRYTRHKKRRGKKTRKY